MNILAFNQLGARTVDNKYTQKDLIRKIRRMATSRGYNNEVANSVINSFVMNGIVEVYNELGYQKWTKLIYEMIDHEYAERRI